MYMYAHAHVCFHVCSAYVDTKAVLWGDKKLWGAWCVHCWHIPTGITSRPLSMHEEVLQQANLKPSLKPSLEPSLKPSLEPSLKPSLQRSLKHSREHSVEQSLKHSSKHSSKHSREHSCARPMKISRSGTPQSFDQHSTAQHSPAQLSTAQHSSPQLSTAQHIRQLGREAGAKKYFSGGPQQHGQLAACGQPA